ncbi:MAG: lysylphosphatidylglycerol synthase transmembrane domain-containing protein [Acidobacteriota bacterium]
MKRTGPRIGTGWGRTILNAPTSRPVVWAAQAGLAVGSSLVLVQAMGSAEFADVGRRIVSLGWPPLLAATACSLARFAIETARWRSLVPGRQRIPLAGLLGARLSGFAVNFVTPGIQVGGEVLRAVTLERRYGIPRGEAVASVASDKAVELAAAAGAAAIAWPSAAGATAILSGAGRGAIGTGVLVLALVAGSTLAFIGRPLAALSGPARALRRLGAPVREGLARVPWRNPAMSLWLLASSGSSWLALSVEIAVVAHASGSAIAPASAASAAALIRLASMLIPVPGGLGAQEAVTVAVLGGFSVDKSAALAIGLVLHARDFVLTAAGLLCLAVRSLGLPSGKDDRKAVEFATD